MRSGRREAWWEYARASLWVLPGASLIVALVLGALLSRVQVSAHSSLHHLLFQGTEDDARNLLIGIMGAVITIIALVLGLTLVALQLSSTWLVLSDAEQLTQQPADLLQVRDQAALLLADGT